MSLGNISIHTTNAQLQMQTTKPVVEMQQNHAKIQIQTELPKVIIDQTECFNTSGLKNNKAFSLEISSKGYQQAMEYIATTSQDSDRLAAIEYGGNPIVDIALRKANPVNEFGLVTMPSARPKIEVTGSLNINFQPEMLGIHNGVNFDVRLGSLDVNYVPGKIEIDYQV